jgi:hypothetical protein
MSLVGGKTPEPGLSYDSKRGARWRPVKKGRLYRQRRDRGLGGFRRCSIDSTAGGSAGGGKRPDPAPIRASRRGPAGWEGSNDGPVAAKRKPQGMVGLQGFPASWEDSSAALLSKTPTRPERCVHDLFFRLRLLEEGACTVEQALPGSIRVFWMPDYAGPRPERRKHHKTIYYIGLQGMKARRLPLRPSTLRYNLERLAPHLGKKETRGSQSSVHRRIPPPRSSKSPAPGGRESRAPSTRSPPRRRERRTRSSTSARPASSR